MTILLHLYITSSLTFPVVLQNLSRVLQVTDSLELVYRSVKFQDKDIKKCFKSNEMKTVSGSNHESLKKIKNGTWYHQQNQT